MRISFACAPYLAFHVNIKPGMAKKVHMKKVTWKWAVGCGYFHEVNGTTHPAPIFGSRVATLPVLLSP